ncbi:hypothetical protein FGO68_gene10393 [Halteria grandinella]|uniref:RING-type domain-containing protein n=1 Tax=Halteria grandinella TaxID=5974 RepID=A0A8J8ND56_HALGN|nr:hypothetical protein FGO68_gene10393 [Halteria grandinella]
MVSHLYCKRRARLHREGRRLWWEQRINNDPLLSDIERYYRHRDIQRFSARLVQKQFKKVLIKIPQGNSSPDEVSEALCPICCQNMEEAVRLTCDPRHLFHKECIQQWLVKHRTCPLCKMQII